jgi:hypothetical protein
MTLNIFFSVKTNQIIQVGQKFDPRGQINKILAQKILFFKIQGDQLSPLGILYIRLCLLVQVELPHDSI